MPKNPDSYCPNCGCVTLGKDCEFCGPAELFDNRAEFLKAHRVYIKKLERGDQILHIPPHAEGDMNHPACEKGFVTSVSKDEKTVFCRYWSLKYPNELRTKAHSEGTSRENLIFFESKPASTIELALRSYCEPE